MYDRSCMLWTLLWKVVQVHPRMKKLQGTFWSANQRFFKQARCATVPWLASHASCQQPRCCCGARAAALLATRRVLLLSRPD